MWCCTRANLFSFLNSPDWKLKSARFLPQWKKGEGDERYRESAQDLQADSIAFAASGLSLCSDLLGVCGGSGGYTRSAARNGAGLLAFAAVQSSGPRRL